MQPLVLVIDDSLVVRTILDTCLRRAGYQVRCFEDGLQALGWLNTTEARIPDLVIIDLGLPRLDGYEVIRLLKARPALEDTVLVILSARDGILDRIKGRLVGAHAYLTKPFKTQEVLTVVRANLGGRGGELLHRETLTHPGGERFFQATMLNPEQRTRSSHTYLSYRKEAQEP